MGIIVKIEGQSDDVSPIELAHDALFSVEYRHQTAGRVNARSTDSDYVLSIAGRLSPAVEQEDWSIQQHILELTKWVNLAYTPEVDFYRHVTLLYEKEEQVVRKLNFTRAYVIAYHESYDNQEGIGRFELMLGQQQNMRGKIFFGEEEPQADTAPKSAQPPMVVPSYFDLMKKWEESFQSVDAISGAAPSRKEIIEDLFTTKLDTFLGISNHKDYRKKVIKRYMSGTPIAQELFLKYVKNNSMEELTKENTSYYTESKKKVFLNIRNDSTIKGTAVVFFHEYGHYIDHAAGDLSEDKTFRECLKNDFRKIMESRAKDLYISELSMQSTPADEKVNIKLEDIMNPDYWNGKRKSQVELKKLYEKVSKEIKPADLSTVSDIFSGLSIVKLGKEKYERVMGEWAHPVEYWLNDANKVYVEAFAHCYEVQFDAGRRAKLRKYFPTAYERFEKLLEGANAKA